jgi:hypothetical protein
MGMNEHFSYNDSTSFAHGFAPLYAGFKIQITREKRALPEIALLSALVLPFTAAESQRPSHTGVNLRLSVSHTLSEIFSLGYNLGVIWDGDTPVPSYYYSVALGISITQKLGAFAEGFGFLPEKGRASHLLDGGITYLVLPNLQLDVSGGIGLTEESPDYFLNCGLCLRLPR